MNGSPEQPQCAAARALARLVALLALWLVAVSLAWFGWVDAPITDGAMLLVAVGLLCAVLAAAAGLLSLEASLGASVSSTDGLAPQRPAAAARWRRLGLGLLLAGLLVLVVAAVLTLNLRGMGADADDEQATATRYTLTRT
jgi:hypothetical protein